MSPGRLYLVPTPIGNLEDMTLRGLRILKEVDWIACEDTRHTRKLLNHYQISKRCLSYFKPKEVAQTQKILDALLNGQTIALVSDAGSPALSDPGEHLVGAAILAGIQVEALPGASALIPALTASGLPTRPFVFMGFPARKKTDLQAELEPLNQYLGTLVFYESPHRIAHLCKMLAEILGDLPAVAAKEISKLFASQLRGSLSELAIVLGQTEPKGEWVLLVHKNSCHTFAEPTLENIDDLYAYFKSVHGITKNRIRKIIQTRKE